MPDYTDTADAKAKTSDIKVTGNPDVWELVCKASSKEQGWAKSTKEMKVPGGRVIQTTTEHRNRDGIVTACSDACVFVPNCSAEI